MIHIRQIALVSVGVVLALFILAVSFWKLTYSAPLPAEEANTLSHVQVVTRLRQMFTPPLLPDSPLYLGLVMRDRFDLLFTSPQERVTEELALADNRLWLAEQLTRRGRLTLSITTLTKAEKYILLAQTDNDHILNSTHDDLQKKILSTVTSHLNQMESMKPLFGDVQRSTIDSLITQMRGLQQSI